ncbi:MAG: hypothetical protein QOJ52_2934 [Acidimicrobiaceae bacterium]|jgi:hypothetical protein|nr:hypothetical protein [Acidimicrobiaceae bacterium]MDQ1364737.1 hypothetical protein [Acidimicrobiaceae bacterium]MDQ1379194.1 hypothetical protein [Acidimicrobiaceae bacterium]MDQ1400417.1 hypothetical protein [Acidimicrobiaceae bacterium]MDQ1413686.1 hypothetical protein [Acidimicrobiaceae bacterium]
MGWFRDKSDRDNESAPWAGPFGPPASAPATKFNPMVRTAGELVADHDEAPATAPPAAAAPAAAA